MSRVLNFILEVLDKVSLVDQERIALIPRKHLQLFSKTLDLYQTVFILSPEAEARSYGRWKFVGSRPMNLDRPIIRIPQTDLVDYEMLADVMVSYMSPKVTSMATIFTDLRDESLAVAYNVLKSMRNLGIAPHIFLVLNTDYRSLSESDKVNIASIVSRVVPQGKYTLIPFSIDSVLKSALRMEIVDYVEKCLADLMTKLHERPLTGTYIPMCFRLEPASIFKDLSDALNLIFYIHTGLLKLSVENLLFGGIDVWKNLHEEVRKLEKLSESKMIVNYVDSDRVDVKALIEFSLRDAVAEGINVISKTVSSGEAVEILTNLRFLNIIKV